MPVYNCATGETRDYTPVEQSAIEAERQARQPQVPAHVPVTELLAAMVEEGALTQVRMDRILNRLKR